MAVLKAKIVQDISASGKKFDLDQVYEKCHIECSSRPGKSTELSGAIMK